MNTININQPDIKFIEMVLKKYPEAQYYLSGDGKSTASSDTVKDYSNTIANKVFGDSLKTDPTEFERAAVALLCFKWVANGDYDSFTKCQKDAIKLSQSSFGSMQKFTGDIVKTPEDLEAAIYSIMCNDMGKTKNVIDAYKKHHGNTDADHDAIFTDTITIEPKLFPGLQTISPLQKTRFINGLKTNFNLGQFAQGENVWASMLPLQNIDKPTRDLFLLHSFYDIAGAAGQVNNQGSLVMSEPVYKGYKIALDYLTTKEPVAAYSEYIDKRGKMIGLNPDNTPAGFALSRIAALSRSFSEKDTANILTAWAQLSKNQRDTLIQELNITGLGGVPAILLYYSPALIDNIKKANPDNVENALGQSFDIMATLYKMSRDAIKTKSESVITVDIGNVAKLSGQMINKKLDITINPKTSFAEIQVSDNPTISQNPGIQR